MSRVIETLTSDRGRRYIYRVATAILLLVAGYGLIEGDKVALWTGVLAAVTELAAANVPNSGGDSPPEH